MFTVSLRVSVAPAIETGSVIAWVRRSTARRTGHLDRRRARGHGSHYVTVPRVAIKLGYNRNDLAGRTLERDRDVRGRDLHDLDAERGADVGAGQVKPPTRTRRTQIQDRHELAGRNATQRPRRSTNPHVDDVGRVADQLEARTADW